MCAACGHESLFLTTSLHCVATVSMKAHMARCHSSDWRPTSQEVVALMRLQMLTGCTMLSQLSMYLAEGRPEPVAEKFGQYAHTGR